MSVLKIASHKEAVNPLHLPMHIYQKLGDSMPLNGIHADPLERNECILKGMICGFLKTACIWRSLSLSLSLSPALSLLLAKMSLEVDSWPSWEVRDQRRGCGVESVKYFIFLSLLYTFPSFSLPFFLHACISSLISLSLQACRLRFTYTSQFHMRATCFIINTTQFNGNHIYVHSHGATLHGRRWLF